MNKSLIIFLSFLIISLLTGCEKDLDTKNVSRITTYAVLTMQGDEAMTIMKGSAFTDPGIIAKIGEEDVTSQVKTTGSVDTNVPGVYTIQYTVINPDNFPATVSRFVGVIDPAVTNIDLSGDYFRVLDGAPQSNRTANVRKGKYPGLYINNNPGGVLNDDIALIFDLYMFHTEPSIVSAPAQPTPVGTFECSNGSYDSEDNSYSWVCLNPGFGTALRTFVKQ